MTENSRILSIIAYYLSEYDMSAINALGFRTRAEAFENISVSLNYDNNYLKMRRDEFDALPTSSSTRKGFRNRPPLNDVVELAEYLHSFSFEELTDIVKALIENHTDPNSMNITSAGNVFEPEFDEEELERLMNRMDSSASMKVKLSKVKYRSFNPAIIKQLKALYKNQCQI